MDNICVWHFVFCANIFGCSDLWNEYKIVSSSLPLDAVAAPNVNVIHNVVKLWRWQRRRQRLQW